MNMIEALNEAKEAYIIIHDSEALEYDQELSGGTCLERVSFLLGRVIRDALMVEAIDKAIDFIESHGLIDKAATLRYKALEIANEKIVTLESELAKLNPPAEHESELYRSDVGY